MASALTRSYPGVHRGCAGWDGRAPAAGLLAGERGGLTGSLALSGATRGTFWGTNRGRPTLFRVALGRCAAAVSAGQLAFGLIGWIAGVSFPWFEWSVQQQSTATASPPAYESGSGRC